MTKNKELVPFAIIKLKKLGFRALGQPIDLNCSDQPHLGPPAMYLTGPGLQSVNGVTVSSLVSCFSWLLFSWSLHLIDYFALSGTVHRPCYQDLPLSSVQMFWIVPWWVRAPPVLSSPSAPSSSYLVEQPCSCCSLSLGAFHREQPCGTGVVQPQILEMPVAADKRQSLAPQAPSGFGSIFFLKDRVFQFSS